jgi:RNA polymerase sigma factor FliA
MDRALALWQEYRTTHEPDARDRLVMTLLPLVRQVVGFRRRHGLPRHCDLDDFYSCGVEALIRAVDRYDPAHGVPLERYVWRRVHGALLDEARRQDWVPRSLRAFQRRRDDAVRRHVAGRGRPPQPSELAAALELPTAELRRLEERLTVADLHSLNAPIGPGEDDEVTELVDTLPSVDAGSQPEAAVFASDADDRVRLALDRLSPRDRDVAEMIYVEDRSMSEVGAVLGVSQSRVSQLHSRIKRSVREAVLAA